MPRNTRDRTLTESRLPQGTAVAVVLGVLLLAGLYLIVSGLA